MRSTILCVDDDRWLLTTLSEQMTQWLGGNYAIEKALSGQEGLDIIDDCIEQKIDISLVISDYIMPGMKGDTFLEQVRIKIPMARRIMLTGFAALDGIANAINKAGIYRYLSKPWDTKDMMLTVLQAIRSYEQDKQTEMLNKQNIELYKAMKKSNSTLQTQLKQAFSALATVADLRSSGVVGHSERVAKYALLFANILDMSMSEKNVLETSALLHDFGKLGLNEEELEAARDLKLYNDKNAALKQAEKAKELLGNFDERFLPGIIYYTERADGQGAFGMALSDIPLNAKIIGLCDYFDTLMSADENYSKDEILPVMISYCNKIFDKALIDKFIQIDFQ